MSVLADFHTFQLRTRKVSHFISEAVVTIGQSRGWSRFIIFGLLHTTSKLKTDIMTVIPFESVHNRAEVRKDVQIQADSPIGMRLNMSRYFEHPPFMSSLVRVARPLGMPYQSKQTCKKILERAGKRENGHVRPRITSTPECQLTSHFLSQPEAQSGNSFQRLVPRRKRVVSG